MDNQFIEKGAYPHSRNFLTFADPDYSLTLATDQPNVCWICVEFHLDQFTVFIWVPGWFCMG